jgi:hypothetical protein
MVLSFLVFAAEEYWQEGFRHPLTIFSSARGFA